MIKKIKILFFATLQLANKFIVDYHLSVKVLIGLFVVGAIAGTAVGHKGYRYVIYDAGFCNKCHVHDYANDAWFESAHYQSTTCHDCHHQSVWANARGGLLTVFANYYKKREKIHNIPKVEDKHCIKCHIPSKHGVLLDIVGPLQSYDISKIIKIEETKGHRVHLLAKTRDPSKYYSWAQDGQHVQAKIKDSENTDDAFNIEEEGRVIHCRDCHGGKQNRAHNFNAMPENCLECHKDISKSNKVVGHLKQNCMLCHFASFLSVERLDPYKE
ncbi:MAG: hypothetical protein WCG27_03330 [Pseudomonadota bacterium]